MLPLRCRQLAAESNANGIKEYNIPVSALTVGTAVTHLEEKSSLCSLMTNTALAFKSFP